MHMPVSSELTADLLLTTVTYTATGSEGLTITVPIGRTMADATYAVFDANNGVTSVPDVDLPTAGRTTTAFPVVTAVQMPAGTQLAFLVVQGAASS